MSTKQISRAATNHKRVRFFLPPETLIEGYVVGMDDYHWLVSRPSAPDIVLVHKGSTPMIEITSAVLEVEDEIVRDRVTKIGQPFWDSLKENR